MTETIKGNILDWPNCTDRDYVHSFQQVNTQGVYNAGLAKQTRTKYPMVYETYMRAYLDPRRGLHLGNILTVRVEPARVICLLIAQETYGKTGIHTNNSALQQCFQKVVDVCLSFERNNPNKLLFPKGIGCGLGGGDWNIVSTMIQEYFPNAILVDYENK